MPKRNIPAIGSRYGGLIVVAEATPGRNGRSRVDCKCDCGTERRAVVVADLLRRDTKSCGCLNARPAGRTADLVGNRYGRLVVIPQGPPPGPKFKWICACDCGNECMVRASVLKGGHTKSCGCLKQDSARDRFRKHGKVGTQEYKIWAGMIQRCTNPRRDNYARYGGAGVTVCKEWLANFSLFYEHVGPRPSPQHTLDRINNDRGYEPGNVRWATCAEQGRNTRRTILIEYDGKTLTRGELASALGVRYGAVRGRQDRGQDPSVDPMAHLRIEHDGRTFNRAELARHLGISYGTMRGRIARGEPPTGAHE